jgi:hypothetical protein
MDCAFFSRGSDRRPVGLLAVVGLQVALAGALLSAQRVRGPSAQPSIGDQAAAEALARCPVQVGTDESGRPTGTTTDVTYVWSLN